ncbi:MAG: SDR family oxidoreductase [Planctomycetota bacterium]
MACVLIAGCGDLGSRVGQRLVAQGHEVWGLRRDPSKLDPAIRPIAADLTRVETLRGLPPTLSHVFYTASAGGADAASYHDAYVQGPGNLLAELARSCPRLERIYFTSSTAVYGQQLGEWVDESSATAVQHETGRLLLAGEAVFRAAHVPATVVRLSGIYGPGRRSLVDLVLSATARLGPPRFTNRIHVDDAAGFLCHLLDLREPAELYLASDDEPADRNAVLEWIAARAGLPADGLESGTPEPGPRARAVGSKRCSNRRMRATGYALTYPDFRSGYGPLVDAVRRGGPV